MLVSGMEVGGVGVVVGVVSLRGVVVTALAVPLVVGVVVVGGVVLVGVGRGLQVLVRVGVHVVVGPLLLAPR